MPAMPEPGANHCFPPAREVWLPRWVPAKLRAGPGLAEGDGLCCCTGRLAASEVRAAAVGVVGPLQGRSRRLADTH